MIEELYQTYHLELVRWCSKMTGSIELAEELVQEAFLRALLNEELLRTLEEKQCRSWLYRTVKNLYIDRMRHQSYESVVDFMPERAAMPDEMTKFEWDTLLESLPDMEGVLFSMRYLQGYNSVQIGEIFSLPPGTVRSRLSSARKHLKEMIGGRQG